MVNLLWNIRHDWFNLTLLPPVLYLNIYYLLVDRGTYERQFHAFFGYLLLDTLWLLLIPQSVASPITIILHHLVCLVGWSVPQFNGNLYAEYLSLGVVVEVNTWLLIARRNFKQSWLLNYLFFASWVAIRLVMYPVVLVLFASQYVHSQTSTHWAQPWDSRLLVVLLMVLINALNFQWSADLLRKTFPPKGAKKGERDGGRGL
ncbi:hypothetical protein B484DRAFT_453160 [Ochromonadaceae sp. CCMP2298]|nr:hypothetical protein B484DRAFT_453160 [Ochromonadaceae sp. CCMP2298]|mmetsp:Transcript_30325/g.67100  ORF Transcript_30325/g.67100 Transcript_30325/m.67100 type:complete len:203 (+) Transcript_30325:154-762(+)